MTKEELRPVAIEIVTRISGEIFPNEVEDHKHMFHDLGFDSLDAVETTMEIEDRLKITIADEDLDYDCTFGELLDRIVARI